MRRIRGLWPSVCVGLMMAMAQPRARAQTTPTPAPTPPPPSGAPAPGSTAQANDAKAIYDHALSLYALGRYAEAAPLFEKAFELKPIPALLYNAAQAHRFAGHAERAVTLYESYLRMFGDPERKGEIEQHIAELKAAIAAQQHAATSPPTGAETATVPATAPSSPTSAPPAVATSSETLTASAPAKPKPLYKKAWFWAAVVGGAAVVAGISVGIAVGTRGHTSPPASFGTVDGN